MPLLTQPTRPKIGEHGYECDIEIGTWQPPEAFHLDGEFQHHLGMVIAQHRHWLAPSEGNALGERIASMIAHYRAVDMAEGLQTAVLVDWLTLLRQYPQHVVDSVCLGWVKTKRWRPLPVDIVERCEDRVAMHRRNLERLVRLQQKSSDG